MLYGIRRDFAGATVRRGLRMRVYVPYGNIVSFFMRLLSGREYWFVEEFSER